MLSCSPRADMETCFISRPTHAGAMSRRPIALLKEARSSRIRAFTQIHPTCIPVGGEYQSKLTLMSESLRNDGRVWVPKRKEDRDKTPGEIPETDRDYYLERKYPSYGNLSPRDISSRAAKEVCDEGRGVGPADAAFISTLPTRLNAWVNIRFASATEICSRSMRRSPAKTPTKCRCGFTRPFTTPWAVSGWIMT